MMGAFPLSPSPMPALRASWFQSPLSRPAILTAACLLALAALPAAQAQTARKPSPYENNVIEPFRAPRPLTPEEIAARKAEDARRGGPAFMARIDDEAAFRQLARVYNAGTPLEIPHVLFVIDRQRGNRIHYLDTPRYGLHETFARERRLLPGKDKAALTAQYKDPNRRLLFGTLSWQRDLPGYTYEFWEGDRLTPELLKLADEVVAKSFYAPVRFKTNSTLHEQAATTAGLTFVTQEALLREQAFLPLNPGSAQGRLRIVASIEATPDLKRDDIVVLDEVPIAIPPVAGLITQRPSTLLSHVNLLAKGWGIPNAYVRDATTALRQYDGQWVTLTVSGNDYRVQPADKPATQPPATPPKPRAQLPKPDLTVQTLKPLDALAVRDSRHCGVKAANLGALRSALPPAASVPDGFCIPFAQYAAFMKRLNVAQRVAALEQRADFVADAEVRRKELAALRQDIMQAAVDPAQAESWRALWQSRLKGAGVFVRSSSNSEDLPGFSGAGLYTTVPNVTQPDALAKAVQTVWASVYNFDAYEARRAAGVPQDAVVMAVLVQLAAPSDSSGVMITRDPFDASRRYVTYISAKRGLGIKVVEGKRQAEQVMYSSWSKAVQVLSRSAEDTQLVADAGGGVREVPIAPDARQVLNDALVARLAAVGRQVKQRLGQVDQDIEWAVVGDKIIILQARPYIDARR